MAVRRRRSGSFRMRLQDRFLQLPLMFDAAVLAKEIASFDASAWMPHPAGYEGNDFLPLISAFGDPANEGFQGPMRPTPYLSAARPYLAEVLGSLGAVLGRTRLMRLSGHAEVSEHVDVNYYWRERMRVHVPIVTQPTVSFHCGETTVNMAAGECWVFDTWSLHRVINDETRARVHLVVDTVGGEGMLQHLAGGRSPTAPTPTGWTPRLIPPSGARPSLEFETVNLPRVMSPWELREHLNFLLSETMPDQAQKAEVMRLTSVFLEKWRALWAAFGEAEIGVPRYRAILEQFTNQLVAAKAEDLILVNHVDFLQTFEGMILSSAISDRALHAASSQGNAA